MPNKPYKIFSPKYLLNTWRKMKRRCLNPDDVQYIHYGGRGIQISESWMTYDNFFRDMASSYVRGLTLDRINNNGNYCKENCRWATKKQQANNTRRNHLFELNGQNKTLIEWSGILGIGKSTLSMRIYVYGWSVYKALTTPVTSNLSKLKQIA